MTDVLLISYLIFTKGGTESRSPILYTIPILMSAAVLGRRAIYITSLVAIICYDFIVAADYLNLVHPLDIVNISIHNDLAYALNSILFFSSILILIGIAADFITQLLIEKEKQASEHLENLNRAQSIAKFGSWAWNLETNDIEWSKVMYELFAVPDESVTLTPEVFFEKIHEGDRKAMYTAIRKARKQHTGFSLDFRTTPNEGEIRYLHGDGQVIEDDGLIKMIGTARDVTEDHLLDQAKNEFVALASHQLRTPTTVVKQYLSMLLDGYAGKLSTTQTQYVDTAYRSNERQITTINDLLNVAQIDSGKMKLHHDSFDLVELLSSIVLEQSIHIADKQQTITLKSKLKHLTVSADRHRLRMALENIIENAHKYSPEHKRIEIRLLSSHRGVQIAIEDHGIGIEQKDIPKIFHKFSRLDNPAILLEEGTGLGLYWVEKVIKLHGGKILVDSKPQKGTTFTIVLPRKTSELT